MKIVASRVFMSVVVAPNGSIVQRFRWVGSERTIVERVPPPRRIRGISRLPNRYPNESLILVDIGPSVAIEIGRRQGHPLLLV